MKSPNTPLISADNALFLFNFCRFTQCIALIILMSSIVGCTTTPSKITKKEQKKITYPQLVPFNEDELQYAHYGKTPTPITAYTFKKALAQQKIVYVAERHERLTDHLAQYYILETMYQQNPELVIGLEWFQAPFQKTLDNYIAGRLSEKELLRQSQYYTRWNYDYRMMRSIMQFAKNKRLPLIALNTDSAITQKIKKNGLSSLNKKELAHIPTTIRPPTKAYRRKLINIFKQKSENTAFLSNLLTIQRISDQTMAKNIVGALKKYPKKRILVFAGIGRIESRFGISGEVDHLTTQPSLTLSVISHPKGKQPQHKKGHSLDVTDYIMYAPQRSLPKPGKLGVLIHEDARGITVKQLSNKEAAYKQGIRKGDRIKRINQTYIHNRTDIKMALEKTKRGDKAAVTITRNGNKKPKLINIVLH